MTAEELIELAGQCRQCRKAHEYREIGFQTRSWADPEDGHPYQPLVQANILELLRRLTYATSAAFDSP